MTEIKVTVNGTALEDLNRGSKQEAIYLIVQSVPLESRSNLLEGARLMIIEDIQHSIDLAQADVNENQKAADQIKSVDLSLNSQPK